MGGPAAKQAISSGLFTGLQDDNPINKLTANRY